MASERKLHRKEEQIHKEAERAMKNDEKLHRLVKKEPYHKAAEKAFHKDEKIHEEIKKEHRREEKGITKKGSKSKKKDPKKPVKSTAGRAKVKKVMEEYKEGKLHSGSKKGPQVRNPKQAIAIALSEARKAKKKK